MKTLTAPLNTQKDAEQSGWVELYDVYLKSVITTPWGTLSTLRLAANYGADFVFFTPTIAPEPTATQGDAATYKPWPITREQIHGSQRFQNDKLSVAASNVTGEFAQMLAAVDWYDVWFVIRKVSTTITTPTADDCAVVFIGQVDSGRINNRQLQFMVSNDLGNLQAIAPRENMHQNCRFNWADDQRTAIRFRQENYKAKTCVNGSIKTRVKSSDLTEDGASPGYIQRDVTADAGTDKISSTGHGLGDGDRVKFSVATGGSIPGGLTADVWYYVVGAAANDFQVALSDGGAAIDISSAGSLVMIDSTAPYRTDLVDALADTDITASSENMGLSSVAVLAQPRPPGYQFQGAGDLQLTRGDAIQFAATVMPVPLVAGTTYYVFSFFFGSGVSGFYVMDAAGTRILVSTPGSGVLVSTVYDYAGKRVRASDPSYWKLPNAGDWGTLADGYWQIPDAQAGLVNAALKPYVQFDFGSAKAIRVWRICLPNGLPVEELVRMLLIFSSADAATWTFESYYELPARAGSYSDLLNPKANLRRYWRICVRSKWGPTLSFPMLGKVRAYENARNWWANGQIKFDANTATAALRNLSRPILASYSGAVDVAAMPAVPASGDTFVIERGCPRTFLACCERRNWENFGGFLDLPRQMVIR